jgi:hypothetical protein
MQNQVKLDMLQAATDLRTGDGLAQSAINRLSGLIQGPAYQPFADELAGLQGRDKDGNQIQGQGLEAAADKIVVLANALPDTLPDPESGSAN